MKKQTETYETVAAQQIPGHINMSFVALLQSLNDKFKMYAYLQ